MKYIREDFETTKDLRDYAEEAEVETTKIMKNCDDIEWDIRTFEVKTLDVAFLTFKFDFISIKAAEDVDTKIAYHPAFCQIYVQAVLGNGELTASRYYTGSVKNLLKLIKINLAKIDVIMSPTPYKDAAMEPYHQLIEYLTKLIKWGTKNVHQKKLSASKSKTPWWKESEK